MATALDARTRETHRLVGGAVALVIGLSLVGIWTNVLGYSTALFGRGTGAYPSSGAFMAGRLIVAVALIALARQVQSHRVQVTVAAALVMAAATCVAMLAPEQTLFDADTLSRTSVIVASMGYTLVTTPFYILLARTVPNRLSALLIALSLVFETVPSVALSAGASPSQQATVLVLAPAATGAAYLASSHLLERPLGNPLGNPLGSQPDGPLGGTTERPKTYTRRERAYLLTRLFVFTVALVCIRALSDVGIWGRTRENYIGMSELSAVELAFIAGFTLLVSVAIFVVPRRPTNLTRSIVGFIVVIAGLQLLAMGDEPLFGTVFDWATESCEIFSHLLMWMTYIECVQETDIPAYRVTGYRSVVYVAATAFFDGYLDTPGAATSSLVIVIVYILFIVVLVPLVTSLIPRHDAHSPAGGGSGGRDAGGLGSEGDASGLNGEGRNPGADLADREGGAPNRAALASFETAYKLSPRESEVFELLLSGATYASVTQATKMSEGTVRTHVSAIYRKLDVHSRQEMADLFEEHQRAAGDSLLV